MKRCISFSGVVSIALALSAGIITLLFYNRIHGKIAVHWNSDGVADSWGAPTNVLILPIILIVAVICLYLIRFFIYSPTSQSMAYDLIDVFVPILTGLLGCIGLFMVDASLTPNEGAHGPANIFCIICAGCLFVSGIAAVFSRRTVVVDERNGSCMIDLSIPQARYVWIGFLVLGSICGLIASLTKEAGTAQPMPGGMPAAVQLSAVCIGWFIAFMISNTSQARSERIKSFE
jgi:hypothetical protein